jgi:transposase
MQMLRRRTPPDRRRHVRAARQASGEAACTRDAAPEVRLPALREDRRRHGRGRRPGARSGAIAGGMPTEALVADVLVSKYADYLLLYRQAQILAREGVTIDRSTLCHRVGFAAVELEPLHARLAETLKASSKLFCDETRCPVLDPGRGKTKTGYLWAIARDDQPWGGCDPPAVAYHYAPGRGGEHARALSAGFSGTLQVDGYAGYNALADAARPGGAITLAFCWSHFRRKFYDIAKGGNAPIASEALDRISALYGIEVEIRGRSAEQRHENGRRERNHSPMR